MFMYYYTKVKTELYTPFIKNDAAECFQNLLELIHYCLNDDPNKRSPDDKC